MRRKRGIAAELLRKSRNANCSEAEVLDGLKFLSLDKSVLSKGHKNLRDGRARFHVGGASASWCGNGTRPAPDDLLTADEKA